MPEDQTSAKPSPFKIVMTWVGAASALIGLGITLNSGLRSVEEHRQHRLELAAEMAVAKGQTNQGEYPAAIQSYQNILKQNGLNPTALQAQLDATMLWVENFQVYAHEGQDAATLAAPQLDQIMVILDAGLTRTKGSEGADVQAHLGWAHWLNEQIAEREFGPMAEHNFRDALRTDPSDAYANAMLGNWMIRNNGDFLQAAKYLSAAAATGRARPFVRTLQLNALNRNQSRGARAQLMKTLNEMRKNSEPLEDSSRAHILSYCCAPPYTHPAELTEFLAAAPPDEVWQTYLWLDNAHLEDDTDLAMQHAMHAYIAADLLDISGKRTEALAKYKALQPELKTLQSSLADTVDAAIKRLAHG